MTLNSCYAKPGKRLGARLAVLVAVLFVSRTSLGASSIVESALDRFPADTVRLEYSSPARLRSLPDYPSLKSRFVGGQLRELEKAFNGLGIRDEDIDEVVLGWKAHEKAREFFGITSGRFDASRIRQQAAAQGLISSEVNGTPIYCFGQRQGNTCMALFDDSTGAFGSVAVLKVLATPSEEESSALKSNNTFTRALSEVEASRPLWGVAVGAAMSDCFMSWLPNPSDLKLDWTQALKGVKALIYSVEPTDTVQLDVRIDCSSAQDASSLGQVLQGVKIFQQLSWQQRNPNQENPYKDLEVVSDAQTVHLQLKTDYGSLERVSMPGTT